MEVSIGDWDKIIQHVQPGLYAPVEKSFSGDFYAVFADPKNVNDFWLLVVQFKSGDKVYSNEMVCEEVYKSFDLNLLSTPSKKEKKVVGVVLVLVGGHYSNLPLNEFNSHAKQVDTVTLAQPEANPKGNNKKTNSKKKPISESEKTKQKEECPIPQVENLQVLLLNDVGKKHLLGTFNVAATKV